MACESYGTSVVPLFHFMPKNGWIFCLILRQQSDYFNNSTFANGEVKEFKEVREVKAICFTTKFTTQKAIGYNF